MVEDHNYAMYPAERRPIEDDQLRLVLNDMITTVTHPLLRVQGHTISDTIANALKNSHMVEDIFFRQTVDGLLHESPLLLPPIARKTDKVRGLYIPRLPHNGLPGFLFNRDKFNGDPELSIHLRKMLMRQAGHALIEVSQKPLSEITNFNSYLFHPLTSMAQLLAHLNENSAGGTLTADDITVETRGFTSVFIDARSGEILPMIKRPGQQSLEKTRAAIGEMLFEIIERGRNIPSSFEDKSAGQFIEGYAYVGNNRHRYSSGLAQVFRFFESFFNQGLMNMNPAERTSFIQASVGSLFTNLYSLNIDQFLYTLTVPQQQAFWTAENHLKSL